jgi:DNA-directed RNA polymerase subunit RPC12/RpoP
MTAEAVTSAKVRKFPCEGCGADLRWEPGATALRCEYCGFTKSIAPSAERIREKSVDTALRAPRDLGWGAERKVIACKRCGAHTTLDPHVAASSCAFCGTSAVVEAPPNAAVVRPEGLLPFRVPREAAQQSFRGWLNSLWFRPSDLKSRSRITNLQGVYIPFWTFDSATDSFWQAEAGYYYYVNVQVRENGKMVTRREQRTRWEPASGTLQMFFDDVPVPASRGIAEDLSRKLEPFPTADLTPYEPSYLSGFLAEENAVDLPEALETAKSRMRSDIRDACSREVPGDTQRNLVVETAFDAVAYKNALLPIWISAYEYHAKPYRFLVNGVTGQCTGTAPWSWVKITLLVLTILIMVMIVLYLAGQS